MKIFAPGESSCVITILQESQVLIIPDMDDILDILIDILSLICRDIVCKNDFVTDSFRIFLDGTQAQEIHFPAIIGRNDDRSFGVGKIWEFEGVKLSWSVSFIGVPLAVRCGMVLHENFVIFFPLIQL